jgi:hypothetical protein
LCTPFFISLSYVVIISKVFDNAIGKIEQITGIFFMQIFLRKNLTNFAGYVRMDLSGHFRKEPRENAPPSLCFAAAGGVEDWRPPPSRQFLGGLCFVNFKV